MENECQELELLLEEIPGLTSTPPNMFLNRCLNRRHLELPEQDHDLFSGDASVQESLVEQENTLVDCGLSGPVERSEQDHALFNGDAYVQQILVDQETSTNRENALFPEGFYCGLEKSTSVGSSVASLPSDDRFLLFSRPNYCPVEAVFSRLTLERQDMGFDTRGVYSPAAATVFRGKTYPSSFGVSGGSLASSGLHENCAPSLGFYGLINDPSSNPQIGSFLNNQLRNRSFGNCQNNFGLQHDQFTVGSSDSHFPLALSSSNIRSVPPLIQHQHRLNQLHHNYNQLQMIKLERQLKTRHDYAVAQKAVAQAYSTSIADQAQVVSACEVNSCSGQGPCSSNFHQHGLSFRSGHPNDRFFADGGNENNMIPCFADNPCPKFVNVLNGDPKFGKYCPFYYQNSCFQTAGITCQEGKFGLMGKVLMKDCSPGSNDIKNTLEFPKDYFRYGSHCNWEDNRENRSEALLGKALQLGREGPLSEVLGAESSPGLFTGYQQQHANYTCLDEVKGQIVSVAKNQHGCRFLQKKFEDGAPGEFEMIFSEINDNVCELMIDPYGNYLVQKLLEVCNEKQRMKIILAVTRKENELVDICLNTHGSRAVQKLIDTLTTQEQISLVMSALRPGAVPLIKDLNGNHVVQRCLQRFSNEDNKFLVKAAADHCVEISTHRHGCCVLQRCVEHAKGEERECLVSEITRNALVLSQDPFGNYVVQYVLDMQIPWATRDVLNQLRGNYACLSMQKFSSNVVEKCLKEARGNECARIVRELLGSPNPLQLLEGRYANYVIQCALLVSKGASHAALVDMIRLHMPTLRNNPYGKKILACTDLKR